MTTTINASTSAGLVNTADTSGILQLQTANTTAVTIDTSQNVGIGTTSPSAALDVRTGTNPVILAKTTGSGFAAVNIDSSSTATQGYLFFNVNGTEVARLTGNASNYLAISTGSSATERMRIDSSGNLQFNSGYGSVATAYGCRAWVKFNGVGTVSITASGGVTSITDNGTGDYTVNFSITFPDAHYALGATCDADTTNGAVCYMNSTSAPSTTACRLATKLLNNSSVDRDRIMAIFIR